MPEPHEVTTGLPRSSPAASNFGAGASSAPQERAVACVELVVRKVQAPGDVAGAKPARGSGSVPAKRPARAGVEHLGAPRRSRLLAHAREVAHEAPAQARGEAARPRRRRARTRRVRPRRATAAGRRRGRRPRRGRRRETSTRRARRSPRPRESYTITRSPVADAQGARRSARTPRRAAACAAAACAGRRSRRCRRRRRPECAPARTRRARRA